MKSLEDLMATADGEGPDNMPTHQASLDIACPQCHATTLTFAVVGRAQMSARYQVRCPCGYLLYNKHTINFIDRYDSLSTPNLRNEAIRFVEMDRTAAAKDEPHAHV